MRTATYYLFNNVSLGSGTSTASSVVYGWDIVRGSVQVNVDAGSISGSFTLQASNQQPVGMPPNQFQPTQWNTIGSSTTLANASSSLTLKTFLMPMTELCYDYYRLVFTDATSGVATGSVTARMKNFSL